MCGKLPVNNTDNSATELLAGAYYDLAKSSLSTLVKDHSDRYTHGAVVSYELMTLMYVSGAILILRYHIVF